MAEVDDFWSRLDVPEPPCTRCSLYERCADKQLACEQFYYYVEGPPKSRSVDRRAGWDMRLEGMDTTPNAETYGQLFSGLEGGPTKRSLVTASDLPLIREALKSCTKTQIANHYGVSRKTIENVLAKYAA